MNKSLAIKVLIVIVAMIVIAFLLESFDIGWTKHFGVKRGNMQREVFETRKSYTHSMAKDLAKCYKGYYEKEDEVDKKIIASYIKMNFGDFDEKKLQNETLKKFLINIRGY